MVAVVGDRDVQQSAQQGGSLHTPTTDHSTQMRITAHAHDHHWSYSSRARVAIAMRLMFLVASSNHLVFAASTGAVSGRTPQGAPGGALYSEVLARAYPGLGRLVPVGFPARTLHVARVSLRIPARRRVAAWSDPAPTAFAWALDTLAWSLCAAASTRAQRSRGHLDLFDYLGEVTQHHRGVLV